MDAAVLSSRFLESGRQRCPLFLRASPSLPITYTCVSSSSLPRRSVPRPTPFFYAATPRPRRLSWSDKSNGWVLTNTGKQPKKTQAGHRTCRNIVGSTSGAGSSLKAGWGGPIQRAPG
ncbi:hypothetical protein Naga_100698g1 [Nannochloropsis gaditana]|uniref:Uncharacterized protein n=1 Tax=Nannochloropsis gaditana TaxID=72520 RepID=W7TRU4_9STRA|nr:hypothetical protein Naga_100698g1 [Nannochloropsis gaditana]